MKIAGIDLSKSTNTIIPIIRGDETIYFEAQCVMDLDKLDEVLEEPEPPTRLMRGQTKPTPVHDDPDYIKKLDEYSTKRVNYLVAKSLLATEGLEWDSVDFSDPNTFANYRDELKKTGFNDYQILQLIRGVMEANGLSEDRVEEAKKRFLAGKLGQQDKSSSPTEEKQTT